MNRVLALFLDQCSGVPEVIGLDVQELTPQDSVLEVVGRHGHGLIQKRVGRPWQLPQEAPQPLHR